MHDKCTFCALYNTGVCRLKKVTKIINKMHYKLYIDNSNQNELGWFFTSPPLQKKTNSFMSHPLQMQHFYTCLFINSIYTSLEQ